MRYAIKTLHIFDDSIYNISIAVDKVIKDKNITPKNFISIQYLLGNNYTHAFIVYQEEIIKKTKK
jgi:hypothetical protein